MTSEQICFVYIVLPGETDFVTAARFRISQGRDGVQVGELIYGKSYLSRRDAVELDPVELRLRQEQYQTTRMNGFFGAIRDAMPDFYGRNVIDYYHKRQLGDFDYLLFGPDDRAGALGFGLNVEPPAPQRQFNKTLNLAELQRVAEVIVSDGSLEQEDRHTALQTRELLLEGTSMGGARPKAVVEHDNNLWIAKFSTPQDRWNQPIVEDAMLSLAKICNLNVPDHKLTQVASKDVLLVKRFDRDKADDGYFRHRMISALTLLQSDDDQVSRGNWSYLLLADELRRNSENPKADLRELFSRICFNALISNTDDHPRNHAMLARGKGWRLSPVYDLTPSPIVAEEMRFLAMDCGMQGRSATRENLISGHFRFLLPREEAEKIIDDMVEIIKREWYSCLRRAGASEKDCTAVERAFLNKGFFPPDVVI